MKKQMLEHNNGCNTYYYGKRTDMITIGMQDMARMMQCNLSQLSGIRILTYTIRFELFFYTAI
jgi:hypothetical protein